MGHADPAPEVGRTGIKVTDGASIDSSRDDAGVVTYIGRIGNWSLNITTGASGVGGTGGAKLDLNTIDYNTTGPGKLVTTLSDTVTAPWTGSGAVASAGGTFNATGDSTVDFRTLIEGQLVSELRFSSKSTGPAFSGTDPFRFQPHQSDAVELVAPITHTGKGSTSFDYAIAPVPEPPACCFSVRAAWESPASRNAEEKADPRGRGGTGCRSLNIGGPSRPTSWLGEGSTMKEEVYSWRIGGPLPRTVPFVLFMAFIAAGEALELLASYRLFALSETTLYYLYPVKTVAVAALLLLYWSEYEELAWRDLEDWKVSLPVALAAVVTFAIWISLDISLAPTGAPKGFNPDLLPSGAVRVVMILFRMAGAVLVVPVMEELFWRSFLIRYLIDPDFDSVEIGRFTWPSFLVTSILFGLEHHFVVAGIAAGVIFNLILYKTRSLAQCILAHAITNLVLGCYVLYTGKWYFW